MIRLQRSSVNSSLIWSFLKIFMNSCNVSSCTSNGLSILAFLPNLCGLIDYMTFLMKTELEERPSAIIGTASSKRDADPEPVSSIIWKNSLAN